MKLTGLISQNAFKSKPIKKEEVLNEWGKKKLYGDSSYANINDLAMDVINYFKDMEKDWPSNSHYPSEMKEAFLKSVKTGKLGN